MVKPKRIVIKEEYCIGCRLCEVHCIARHSRSKDIIKAYKGVGPRPVSGICFEEKGSVSFAIQCRHCDGAPCVENCLTGAMYRDGETGRILHDREKCVGCWMCVMLCPLGVIKIDYGEKKVVSKCDLCIEGDFPACVEHCPNEAICLVDGAGVKIEKGNEGEMPHNGSRIITPHHEGDQRSVPRRNKDGASGVNENTIPDNREFGERDKLH